MEEPNASKGHGDAILVAGHDDVVVTHGATCLSDVLHAALMSPFDVVAEGEESVAAQRYARVLSNPLVFLL